MSHLRAHLSFVELYQLKGLLGTLLVLLSLWTVFTLEINSGLLLIAVALGSLAVFLAPALPGRIPAWAWKAATPLLILWVLADFVLSRPDIIPPLVRMIVLLVLFRVLQERRKREDLQLILLCLFMVIIAGVLTLSLTFAVQIVLFTPCAMLLLFIVTLTEFREREEGVPPHAWRDFRWGRFLRRMATVVDFRLIALTAVLFAGVVTVSSAIFVLMPRFRLDRAIPFLNLNSDSALSGFTDNIQFGDIAEIISDDRVALRVDVEGEQDPPQSPYWRMVVLDEYWNGGFRTSVTARSRARTFSDNRFGPPRRSDRDLDEGNSWTFYLEGGISKYLPLAGQFRVLRFQNRQDVEFNWMLRVLATKNISSSVLFYQLNDLTPVETFSVAVEERGIDELEPMAVDMSRTLAPGTIQYPQTTLVLPGGEANLDALRAIVEEITRGEELNAREFANRAIGWLQERHGYSLRSRIPSGDRDIMVRWLLSDQPGHCELFAGAFTLLARTAGYPTRVVTGFKGGSWNGYENYYMVRNRDAHAWVEMYDREGSWIRVDPTPGAGRVSEDGEESAEFGFLRVDRTLRAYLDSLRILWYRRIVNFDEEQQQELASNIKDATRDTLDGIKARIGVLLAGLREWLSSPWTTGKVLLVVYWAGVAIIGLVLIRTLPSVLARLLARIGLKSGYFGEGAGEKPIRRRAGRLIRKLHDRRALLLEQGRVSAAEFKAVRGKLLTLRYGAGSEWPEPNAIFREARGLLRRRGPG